MNQKRAFLIPLLLLLAMSIPPQEQGAQLFAPFVTQLSGEVVNATVHLRWIDTSDAKGPVYIYRSPTPLGPDTYNLTEPIAQVPYGTQAFTSPADAGVWYYLALASSELGIQYTLVIPFTNALVLAVPGEAAPPQPVSAARPEISAVEAAALGEGIMISYHCDVEDSPVLLYRSANPIVSEQDLARSDLLQSVSSSPYLDYPDPGIPYYYAMVLEEELLAGSVDIRPGVNATVNPVLLAAAVQAVDMPQAIRGIPLPRISLATVNPELRQSEVREIPLSARALRVLADIQPRAPVPYQEPQAVRGYLDPAPSSPALAAIVQGPFSRGDWATALEELREFLSLHTSAGEEARAAYYVGQSYFFIGLYREALFEFLRIERDFPYEAEQWIQLCLEALVR